jgi:hypothetical protein
MYIYLWTLCCAEQQKGSASMKKLLWFLSGLSLGLLMLEEALEFREAAEKK